MQVSAPEFVISVFAGFVTWLLTAKATGWLQSRTWRFNICAIFIAILLSFLIGMAIPALSNKTQSGIGPAVQEEPPNRTLGPEESFIKQYVVNSQEKGQWAVLVRTEEGKPSELLGAAEDAIREKGYSVGTPFRSAVYDQAPFTELFQANAQLLRKLNGVCDGLIVGQASQTSTTAQDPERLITARQALNIRIFSTESGLILHEFQISAKGGGFSEGTAQSQARARMSAKLKAQLLREQY